MTLDINTIRSYDPTAYSQVQERFIQSTGKTAAEFEAAVSSLAANEMLSANDVLRLIDQSLPQLENPVTKPNYPVLTTMPSPGASVLALLTDITNEQRKITSDARIESTKVLVAKMREEADTIREKATAQLIMGLVSGTIQIAGGITTAGMSGSALKNGLAGEQLAAKNNLIQGVGQVFSGTSKIMDTVSNSYGLYKDAEIVTIKSDEEQVREMRERMSQLDESMRQLINRTNSTIDSIVQSSQQARNKILA
mgnify:CR=1 FL=1